MSTEQETDRESKARLVRIESRLISFARAMGVDLKDEARCIHVVGDVVTLSAADVSLSTIFNACRKAGSPSGTYVSIFLPGDKLLGSIKLP